MSSEKCRLKEISDKYWSVAESIFGFTEDIGSYKFIVDESTESVKSNEVLTNTENAALNFQLLDVLHDRSREGLVSIPDDLMIKVNNKILIEDYEAALLIITNGIENYGSYRELLDLKRILERKCSINQNNIDNQKLKPLMKFRDSLNYKKSKYTNSASESEFSNETNSRTESSSNYTNSKSLSISTNEISVTDDNYEISSSCDSLTDDTSTYITKNSSDSKIRNSHSKASSLNNSYSNNSLLESSKHVTLPSPKNGTDINDDDDDENDDTEIIYNQEQNIKENYHLSEHEDEETEENDENDENEENEENDENEGNEEEEDEEDEDDEDDEDDEGEEDEDDDENDDTSVGSNETKTESETEDEDTK